MTGCMIPGYSLFAEDLDGILEQTKQDWDDLRGNRIFVTGGTGFFGKWLIESFLRVNDLLGLGAELVVLSRNPERFVAQMPHLAQHRGLTFHPGDVRHFEFPRGTFSHVIHAATEASATLNVESPMVMFDTIVAGTNHVLEFAKAAGTKKFLLTSSGAVYGQQPSELTHVPEEYPGAPDPLHSSSAYGEGKRVAELLCAVAHRLDGLDVRIARCYAFVGPYLPLDIHFAVGNFLRDVIRGEPICIRGDGRTYRSYLYAADLTAWLWKILLRGSPCRMYNVGSDQAMTILEIAQAVAALNNGRSEIRVQGSSTPTSPPYRYIPSTERIRRELGATVTVDFTEALARTFKWLQMRELSAGDPLSGEAGHVETVRTR